MFVIHYEKLNGEWGSVKEGGGKIKKMTKEEAEKTFQTLLKDCKYVELCQVEPIRRVDSTYGTPSD